MITETDKTEAEKFLRETQGANPSHASLAEECTRLRAENEGLKKTVNELCHKGEQLVQELKRRGFQ